MIEPNITLSNQRPNQGCRVQDRANKARASPKADPQHASKIGRGRPSGPTQTTRSVRSLRRKSISVLDLDQKCGGPTVGCPSCLSWDHGQWHIESFPPISIHRPLYRPASPTQTPNMAELGDQTEGFHSIVNQKFPMEANKKAKI
jgi:hypothetical protein